MGNVVAANPSQAAAAPEPFLCLAAHLATARAAVPGAEVPVDLHAPESMPVTWPAAHAVDSRNRVAVRQFKALIVNNLQAIGTQELSPTRSVSHRHALSPRLQSGSMIADG